MTDAPNPIVALLHAVVGEHPSGGREVVILMHGLARTSTSLLVMEWRLRQLGYDVINVNYPSTAKSIEERTRLGT